MNSVLKNQNLSGAIGELIACYNIRRAYRIRTTSPNLIRKLLKKGLIDEKTKDLLIKNWVHYDIVAFVRRNNQLIPRIYEVKTRKIFKFRLNKLHSREKITEPSLEAYEEAQRQGIEIRLVLIRLFDNWKYTMQIKKFSDVRFWVDRRKRPFRGRHA